MEIRQGQYAVLRNGTVTGALDYIRTHQSVWFWQGMGVLQRQRWTREGYWSTEVQPHPLDIIKTFNTKEEAVAFSIHYLDRLDKPNRRGRPQKDEPLDNDASWGDWETDSGEWNTGTHDIQFECIDGIHRLRRRPRRDLLPKTYWVFGNTVDDLNVMNQKPSSDWPICFEVEVKK